MPSDEISLTDAEDRALRAAIADERLWADYVATVAAAEALDHDFPEENYDGPVGRLHIMNAKIMSAAVKAHPQLSQNFPSQARILDTAYGRAKREAEKK